MSNSSAEGVQVENHCEVTASDTILRCWAAASDRSGTTQMPAVPATLTACARAQNQEWTGIAKASEVGPRRVVTLSIRILRRPWDRDGMFNFTYSRGHTSVVKRY